ncbi:MAG: hypothetical protein ACI85O_003680 [Saprospiraceae bacterium]|jgi:hypothetical protein
MSNKPIKKSDQKKAWNRRKLKQKPYEIEIRDKAKVFLIICEGQNTEPEYFKSFPVLTATVESYGTGSSRARLVEQVVDIKRNEDLDKEIWVVFDMDIQRDNAIRLKVDFDDAIALAQANDIKIAYANDAFELWFLLHYIYFDNEWTRHEYYQKLSELWGLNYEKSGKNLTFCRSIYHRLVNDVSANQKEAMRRAKKLLTEQSHKKPCERNPCTTIHCLVDELNKHISRDLFLDICEE